MSTNTGFAPRREMEPAVAKNVYGTVTTSSPGPTPQAMNANKIASVPEATPTAWLTPTYFWMSFSNDFGGAVHPRAYDGHAAGQRFQIDPWQSLPQGGQHQHIETSHNSRNVTPPASQPQHGRKAPLFTLSLDGLAQLTVPHQQELHLGSDAMHQVCHTHKVHGSLLRLERRNHPHHRPVRLRPSS